MAGRYSCRCRKCDARKTLARHPDTYHPGRAPKCACGVRDWRVDPWMMGRNTRAGSCYCPAYHFPHRKGSLFCWFRSDGSDRFPEDADFRDRAHPHRHEPALALAGDAAGAAEGAKVAERDAQDVLF